MAMRLAEVARVTEQHLDAREVAAYVDRAATPSERARLEGHLANCPECRAEVSDAARIIATLPRSRVARRSLIASAAGIAAMLLVFLWPRVDHDDNKVQHR